MDHPKRWLRYIDAKHVQDRTLDVDGMKVRNHADETLGSVKGFIVNSESGRPYYIVIDAGGWFKSRHFLAPLGTVHLQKDKSALLLDLSKEQLGRFPGFDLDEFDRLTESDLKRINDDIVVVVEPGYVPTNEPYSSAWGRDSFKAPDWWDTTPLLPKSDRDASPHFDGRAQPGDVLFGVETGGERTYVGDTKEDEDDRRKTAEHTAAKTHQ